MPGIPIINIGNALGGLANGWQQSQQSGQQQALRQLALQQAQSQQNSQRLAALALQAGLLGGQNSQTPLLPQTTANPVPPPMPGQASMPAAPQQQQPPPQMAPPDPTAFSSFDAADAYAQGRVDNQDATGNPNLMPPQQGPAAAPVAPPSAGDAPESNLLPHGNTPDTLGVGKTGPTDTDQVPANGGTGPQASSGSGSDMVAVLPGGQQISIGNLFQQVNPTHLAQGIAKLAPPGTDPADIYNATSDLMKMANGDKLQQQQAAYMAKLLMGNLQFQQKSQMQQNTFAHQDQTLNTREGGMDKRQQAGFGEREKLQGQRETAIDARAKARLDQQAQALQARAQAQGGPQAAAIAQQVRALRAQAMTIKPADGVTYSDEQQAQLKTIADKIGTLADQLAKQTQPK